MMIKVKKMMIENEDEDDEDEVENDYIQDEN
jgi:hypothetical protein